MARDPIKDGVVDMFDAAHRVADNVLWPLKPVDSLIHGTAIGIKNWLCDEHPGKQSDCDPSKEEKNEKKKPVDHKDCDEPHSKDKGKGGNSIDNSGSNKYNNTTGNANNNTFSGGSLAYTNEKKKPADNKDCDDPHSKDKGKGGNSIDNSGNNKYNNTTGNANNNTVSGGSLAYNG